MKKSLILAVALSISVGIISTCSAAGKTNNDSVSLTDKERNQLIATTGGNQANVNKTLSTIAIQKSDIFSSFKKDADYKTIIRPKMLKDGWQPARSESGEMNCASGGQICTEYPELEAGPSSPMGDAIFRWKKNDKVVNIFTYDNELYNRYEFEKADESTTKTSISDVSENKIKEFMETKGSGSAELSAFAQWNFTNETDQYELKNNGRGKRTNGERHVTDFRLSLRDAEVIDNSVYFTEYKNDLLILYGVTVAGAGAGNLVRLDGATLKPKWNANIANFNVSKGIVENQFAYLGASGFVAKIDLDSGKYVWKHDDLYRKYNKDGAFNSLEVPEIRGDTVIFTEKQDNSGLNSIVLDKKSGKVIKVNTR